MLSSFNALLAPYSTLTGVCFIMDQNNRLVGTSKNEMVWVNKNLKPATKSNNSIVMDAASYIVSNAVNTDNTFTTYSTSTPGKPPISIYVKMWSDQSNALTWKIVVVTTLNTTSSSSSSSGGSSTNTDGSSTSGSTSSTSTTSNNGAAIAAAIFSSFVFAIVVYLCWKYNRLEDGIIHLASIQTSGQRNKDKYGLELLPTKDHDDEQPREDYQEGDFVHNIIK